MERVPTAIIDTLEVHKIAITSFLDVCDEGGAVPTGETIRLMRTLLTDTSNIVFVLKSLEVITPDLEKAAKSLAEAKQILISLGVS